MQGLYLLLSILFTGTKMPGIYDILNFRYYDDYLIFVPLTALPTKILFNIVAIAFALITLLVFILVAVFNKKIRVLAIFAGLVNSFAVLIAPWWARMHHTIPVRTIIADILEGYWSPDLIAFIGLALRATNILISVAIVTLAFILSTACIVKGLKGKRIGVLANIINVFRFIVLRPYSRIIGFISTVLAMIVLDIPLAGVRFWEWDTFGFIINALGALSQLAYMVVYLFIVLSPIIILLVASIKIASKEKKEIKSLKKKAEEEEKAKAEEEAKAELKAIIKAELTAVIKAEMNAEAEAKTEEKVEEKTEEKPAEAKAEEKVEAKTEEKSAEEKTEEKPAEAKTEEKSDAPKEKETEAIIAKVK